MDACVGVLFEPLKVKGKALRNRIVMPPMVQLRPITTSDGIEWYRERSVGGVGLVIVEATAVNRFGSELTPETLSPLVEAIHEGGALAAIQLFPVTFDFPRNDPLPSPVGLSLDVIADIVKQYEIATEICADAGFDGVEPHGAHNYPINQFFSPIQNTRTDTYGGNLANRMRFALEIVAAVRKICDRNDMLVFYRHTPSGNGYEIDDSLILGRALVDTGVDVLDISPASVDYPADRAEPFMSLGVPVIAVNLLDDVNRAVEVLHERRADLIAVGRGLIADPDWPRKIEAGLIEDVVRCMRCDEGCFGNLKKGVPVECVEWDLGQ